MGNIQFLVQSYTLSFFIEIKIYCVNDFFSLSLLELVFTTSNAASDDASFMNYLLEYGIK